MALIDKESITSIIEEVGVPIKLFLPEYTTDVQGDVKRNYLTDAIVETVLIRPRTDTNVVNEQGLQYQGDALGYFKSDSKVQPEAEVWVEREEIGEGGSEVVYFVISIQASYFEGELKFIKGILQRRRY